MRSIYLTLVIVYLVTQAHAAAPDRYVLDVQSDCGSSYTGTATIKVVTGMPARATAVCANGEFPMNITGQINHSIDAHYSSDSDECVFFRRLDSRTYLIHVMVTIDDNGNDIQQDHQKYTVTCAFNNPGSDDTVAHDIVDSYLAPLEIQTNMGSISDSVISLYFIDLNGEVYPPNSNIPIMKGVHLVAETDGAGGDVGLQVTSCDSTGILEGAMNYPFLRAGCGDGLVLAKTAGFTTGGMKAVSDPFLMFHVAKNNVIKVTCNVTLCNTACNGSSCMNEVIRRETHPQRPELEDKDTRIVELRAVMNQVDPSDTLTGTVEEVIVTIAACVTLVVVNIVLLICLYVRKPARKRMGVLAL